MSDVACVAILLLGGMSRISTVVGTILGDAVQMGLQFCVTVFREALQDVDFVAVLVSWTSGVVRVGPCVAPRPVCAWRPAEPVVWSAMSLVLVLFLTS